MAYSDNIGLTLLPNHFLDLFPLYSFDNINFFNIILLTITLNMHEFQIQYCGIVQSNCNLCKNIKVIMTQ